MSITNEVLATKIDNLDKRFAELSAMVQAFSGTFVSHEVFELRMKELDSRIRQAEADNTANSLEIEKLKNRKNIPVVLTGLVTALLTSVFTYLIISRLQQGG